MHTNNENDNDSDNDNEIDLFRYHNGNNANTKVIFKQMTLQDKCNCIMMPRGSCYNNTSDTG